jgi:hypothetical protein
MKEPVYGFPCVENPHDFEPDPDSCTAKEIACWEEAKRRWDCGERDVLGARCHNLEDDNGNVFAHVTATSWGIGTNYMDMYEISEMFADSEEES